MIIVIAVVLIALFVYAYERSSRAPDPATVSIAALPGESATVRIRGRFMTLKEIILGIVLFGLTLWPVTVTGDGMASVGAGAGALVLGGLIIGWWEFVDRRYTSFTIPAYVLPEGQDPRRFAELEAAYRQDFIARRRVECYTVMAAATAAIVAVNKHEHESAQRSRDSEEAVRKILPYRPFNERFKDWK